MLHLVSSVIDFIIWLAYICLPSAARSRRLMTLPCPGGPADGGGDEGFAAPAHPPPASVPPPLPLEWTRMGAAVRLGRPPRPRGVASAAGSPPRSDPAAPTVLLSGTAVLLLPRPGCGWFQGQFVPALGGGRARPMGLLGVDRDDVDECLLGCCGEDGYEGQHYREVDLTVFMGGRRAAVMERVLGTGGDMLCLSSGLRVGGVPGAGKEAAVRFEPRRLLLGRDAAPLLVRYFRSVIDRVSTVAGGAPALSGRNDSERRALWALPEAAVVVGSMALTVPRGMAVTASVGNQRRSRRLPPWRAPT